MTERKNFNLFILILSFLTTTVLILKNYPGFFYSDSYSRIGQAISFSNENYSNLGTNWLSTFPQVILATLYSKIGNVAIYMYFQCLMYYFSFLNLLFNLTKSKKFIIIVWFFLSIFSVFKMFSLHFAPSSLTTIGILLMLDYILSLKRQDNLLEIKDYIYFLFLVILIVGSRPNSLTIIPVILVGIYYFSKQKINTLKHLFLIFLALFYLKELPNMLHINQYNVTYVGFKWEILNILNEIKLEDENKYRNNYINYLREFEKRDNGTQESVNKVNYNSIYSGWHDYIDWKKGAIGNNPMKLKKKYINLIINEPKYFFKMKLKMWGKSLGITDPLNNWEYNYNRWNRMEKFGFSDSEQRLDDYNKYITFQKKVKFFLKPYQVYCLSIIFISVIYFFTRKKEYLVQTSYIFLLSIFYYSAFLIITQSHEVRYFSPSLILNLLIYLYSIHEILFVLYLKYIKKYFDLYKNKIFLIQEILKNIVYITLYAYILLYMPLKINNYFNTGDLIAENLELYSDIKINKIIYNKKTSDLIIYFKENLDINELKNYNLKIHSIEKKTKAFFNWDINLENIKVNGKERYIIKKIPKNYGDYILNISLYKVFKKNDKVYYPNFGEQNWINLKVGDK